MSRGTVFLVDDDDALRRATQRLLRSLGFEVRGYSCAESFLEELDGVPAGCLLLDLRMGGLSGLELQQVLLDRGQAPPIVFLTGHADEAARARAMDHGAVAFLAKPATERTLVEALEEALARVAGGEPPGPLPRSVDPQG